MINFDVVLTQIGGFNRAQIGLGFIVCYSAIICGLNTISPIFVNYTPDFRCLYPPLENKNYTEAQILNLTTPLNKNGKYDFCKKYGYNETCSSSNPELCIEKSVVTKCNDGYYFDKSIFPQTVVTEFQLVCENSYLSDLATSWYMGGLLIGSVFFGHFCDRYGRKKVLITSALLAFTGLFVSSKTRSYTMFVVMRTVTAVFGYGLYLSSFIFVVEICEAKSRHILGVGYQAMFSVGVMIESALAYRYRDWHDLLVASAVCALPFAFGMFFAPESPRWLFSVGKDEQGKSVSRWFAKLNGKQINEPEIWENAEQRNDEQENDGNNKEEEHKYSLKTLMKSKIMRVMVVMNLFTWFVNNAVYYGISFQIDTLKGDVFVNNAISGALDIVAQVLLVLVLERVGRRIMLMTSLGFAGVALILSTISNSSGSETVGLVFAFCAKFGVAISFSVIYNLTSELFPTVIRTNAVGISSVFGRLGSIMAPLLLTLQNGSASWLPNTILGLLGIVCSFVAFAFPETTDMDMLETIEEAKMFYKNEMGFKNKINNLKLK